MESKHMESQQNEKTNMYPDVPPPYNPSGPQAGYPHPPEGFVHPSEGYPNVMHSQGPQLQPQVQPMLIQAVAATVPVGPNPMVMFCPSCRAEIRTDVKHEASTKTHLMALLLCLLCWPCTCVPYCVDSCQNANHYCPSCQAFIGAYKN